MRKMRLKEKMKLGVEKKIRNETRSRKKIRNITRSRKKDKG